MKFSPFASSSLSLAVGTVIAATTQIQSATAAGIYYKVTTTVTNLAPMQGTCQTPVWVGIHDGTFDVYDRDVPASPALERIAEDGTTGPLVEAFAASQGGVVDGVVGSKPICPGESATLSFEVLVKPGAKQFFSYTSMVVPSNDAFLANGDPMAFKIFDEEGEFVPVIFEDLGSDVLDAGTEMNDEIPANTAFFGQMVPNTGVPENGVITTHPGFLPATSGGILNSTDFVNADFKQDGYKMMKIEVTAKKLMVKTGSIKVLNMAPEKGTCQAPTWVGIHDGTFDVYDRDVAASPGLESLAEDGDSVKLSEEFAAVPGTLWDGVVGDKMCSGESAIVEFEIRIVPGQKYYFSYASMVLPSNDAFIANGDPLEHKIIDETGELFDLIINDFGTDVLDAGTEMNDELPENTAFFGQSTPDTGVDENGVVVPHSGFKPVGSGGILLPRDLYQKSA